MEQIAALVAVERGWRAVYAWADGGQEDGLSVEQQDVVCWAAASDRVWAVRLDPATGQGVLVGGDADGWAEAFVTIVAPHKHWESVEHVDARVRGIISSAFAESTDEEE